MKSSDSETRMLLSPDSEFFKYFNNPNPNGAAPAGGQQKK
jgi:hypothetical protein